MKSLFVKTTVIASFATVALATALVIAPLSFDGLNVAKAGDPNPPSPTLGGVVKPPQLPPVQTHPPRSPITGR